MSFTDPSKNQLNEGDPPVSLDNGSVQIDPKPVITVSPETGLLISGDRDIVAADIPMLVEKYQANAADWFAMW